MQREMPWIQAVQEPELVDQALVKKCKKFSEAVALSIHLSGYSQETIAKRIGMSPAQFSRLKNRRRGVNDKVMDNIAHATGNYVVSQYIAQRDGFILVRPAKSKRMVELEEEMAKEEAKMRCAA